MAGRVEFYQLTHKFVSRGEDIPEGPRQVMYYSLAIGHHVGVMDCFQKWLDISLDEYQDWLAGIPEGRARHKLAGVVTWGEIEINHSHARDMLPVLLNLFKDPTGRPPDWVNVLTGCLRQMLEEPALYLMIRRAA